MDYKFIILLIVLLGLIFFLTKELNSVRNDLDEKIKQIVICIDDNSKTLKNKIQADLNICVGKIKTINGDYIERVRKMNEVGSQPITNMSNNYTDTDSNENNDIQYLSDVRKAPKTQSIPAVKESSFYMSEDVPIIIDKKNPISQKESITNNKESITNNKESITNNKESITNNKESITNNIDQFKISYSDSAKKNMNSSAEKFVKKIDSKKELVSKSSSKSHSSEKKSNDKNIKNKFKSTTDLIDNDDDEQISDIEDDESSSNESETDSLGSTSNKNEQWESVDSSESEPTNSDPSDGVSIEIEQTKKKQAKKSENSSLIESSKHSSNYGSITLGSKKPGVKPSSKIEIKKTQKDTDSVSSQSTSNFASSLTIASLKPLAKYTLEYLKKVAKTLSIPLMYKEGVNRRYFRKDELYDKIKTYLIERDESVKK
jgi:hypothetical protein